MIYVSVNNQGIITSISKRPFLVEGQETIKINRKFDYRLVGKKLPKARKKRLRIAVICNWEDKCGISTYSKFLIDAITPLVDEIKIFAEDNDINFKDGRAIPCWKRGESMVAPMKMVLDWKPDLVLIQHEFGIFPKATYFLQMLQMLENTPYVITLHSVYEHLDKAVCTASIKNMVVHSEQGKDILKQLGNQNNIHVIPHGCLPVSQKNELYNCFHTPYPIFQFGFGFFYKGVEVALDAIHYLKTTDKKFEKIFYCYLCSESDHCKNIHNNYYQYLLDKINKLGLQDNAVILKGFFSDQELEYFLRTMKMAIFPYVIDPNNVVYGASGAVRIAMRNKIPVIASPSHLFDDLNDILPRPKNYLELAKEIDKIFSNSNYQKQIIANSLKFIEENSWPHVAANYVKLFDNVIYDHFKNDILEEKKSFWQKLLSWFGWA